MNLPYGIHLVPELKDVLILAVPEVLVVLAGIAVLCAGMRWWRAVCVVLLCAVGLNIYTEQVPLAHPFHAVPQEKPEGALRIMSYNICGKKEYAECHKTEEFLSFIRRTEADFLFLPENTEGTAPVLCAMLDSLYPYSLKMFPEFHPHKSSYEDFTLYSRYPLTGYKNYHYNNEEILARFPYLDKVAVKGLGDRFLAYEATADVNGQPVTLLHVHLHSNRYGAEQMSELKEKKEAKKMFDNLLAGYVYRKVESETIVDSLRHCQHPLIIAGDFNDLSGSDCIRRLQTLQAERGGLSDAWWQAGFGFGFTFAAQQLRLRLDHILYSADFRVRAIDVPHVRYSDHYPLIVDLEWVHSAP